VPEIRALFNTFGESVNEIQPARAAYPIIEDALNLHRTRRRADFKSK
jgi:hypothetical protein